MSVKLRWSENIENMYPDVQSYQQTMLIGVATSLLRLPKITDDFTHIFPNEEDKNLVRKFRTDLRRLGTVIDERNEKRAEPFYAAHPDYLEISMSV